MKIREIIDTLDALVLCGDNIDGDVEIHTACGCDLMSDALAYVKKQGMLLTGLSNPQAVRTAEMLDIHCVAFVRGKIPGPEIIELARAHGIVLLSTRYRMFTACGKLYAAGIRGSDE